MRGSRGKNTVQTRMALSEGEIGLKLSSLHTNTHTHLCNVRLKCLSLRFWRENYKLAYE